MSTLRMILLGLLAAGGGVTCPVGSVFAGEQTDTVPSTGGGNLTYELPESGQVTLVVEDAAGQRIRNLIAATDRPAGRNSEFWDGLDDRGQPVAPGEYRWRGLRYGPITSHFQGAFYSPGNPPWCTLQRPSGWYLRGSGGGGWLSDHERPLCLYADGSRVFVGAEIAEAGHSIIQVNLEGEKQWGTLWLSLSGANAIATDGEVLYVAGEKGWMKDALAVNRIDLKNYGWLGNPPEIRKLRTDACFIKEKSADFSGIRGVILTPRFIILALTDRSGRLAFFDREKAVHLKDLPLPRAGAVAKHPAGGWLAFSGAEIVRLDLENGQHQVAVAGACKIPGGLGVDAQGNLYATDLAPEEQCIKVFSPAGTLLRRIGTPGGRREGKFNPQAMGQPVALTIDALGQIWVAEHDYLPKRVSVWTTAGQLVRDYLGPPHYGGGGALDPRDPARAFYRGMEFACKKWPEPSTLTAVLFRPEEHEDLPFKTGAHSFATQFAPQYPVYAGDKLYLMQDDNYGLPGVLIGEVRADRLHPRVIFGSLNTLWYSWRERHAAYVQTFVSTEKPPVKGVFLWQDADGNGKAEPAEVTIDATLQFGALWAMRSWPTLNLYARRGNELVTLAPAPDLSALHYDFKRAQFTPLPAVAVKQTVCATSPDGVGNVLINCGGGGNQGSMENALLSLAPDGRVNWSYPNPFPANWHNSPRPRAGDIQHTLNVEGIVTLKETKERIFQLNGNKGVRYLFTADGLFITRLFGDARFSPLQQNLLQATFDMRLDENSLGDECFSGWLGQAPDGRVLQIIGKDSSNIAEVRGLETVRRLPGGSVQLKQAVSAAAAAGSGRLPPLTVIQAGGIPRGWEAIARFSFPQPDPVASVSLGTAGNLFFFHLDVTDATPFENNGEDVNTLFHTGDAVDLMLATDPALPASRVAPQPGDCRYVVAMYQNKPVVVRYDYVVAGGVSTPIKFASPTGVAAVDRITLVKNAEVNVTRNKSGYAIDVRMPFAEMGFARPPAGAVRGDVGVLFGDPTGTRVVNRVYYYNQQGGVVSDIPSEVRVSPAQWGAMLF